MNLIRSHLFILIAAATLAACSSTPERIDILENARATVADVEAHPRAGQWAGDELQDAQSALANAEYLQQTHADYDDIYHEAYLALRNAEIAQERIAEAETREKIGRSEAERTRVLLMAREAEVNEANRLAEERERDAAVAQSIAIAKSIEADRARDLAAANAAAAAQKASEAAHAEQAAEAAKEEQRRLKALVEDLEAEKTDRGYILTLGDILFDTDKSVIKPGADITLDRLAKFLQDYPDRRLIIEGHADSRGTDAYNLNLSDSRASAVKLALIDRGIDPGRLEVKGLGENYPVATNETVAGRQQNRRVEIVFSDAEGLFPAAAMRTASTH